LPKDTVPRQESRYFRVASKVELFPEVLFTVFSTVRCQVLRQSVCPCCIAREEHASAAR
jgi:hypothetical protein